MAAVLAGRCAQAGAQPAVVAVADPSAGDVQRQVPVAARALDPAVAVAAMLERVRPRGLKSPAQPPLRLRPGTNRCRGR